MCLKAVVNGVSSYLRWLFEPASERQLMFIRRSPSDDLKNMLRDREKLDEDRRKVDEDQRKVAVLLGETIANSERQK